MKIEYDVIKLRTDISESFANQLLKIHTLTLGEYHDVNAALDMTLIKILENIGRYLISVDTGEK